MYLVYLAAYLIPSGEPMLPTALSDTESLITTNLEVDQERGYHMLKSQAFRDALYGDCSDEDVVLASALLTPEPNVPAATPLQLSEANFGQVPRVYIETLQDKGATLALQKLMYSAIPCQRVISMETSHSPFLCELVRLAGHLPPCRGSLPAQAETGVGI